jgi:hypothetical protein
MFFLLFVFHLSRPISCGGDGEDEVRHDGQMIRCHGGVIDHQTGSIASHKTIDV